MFKGIYKSKDNLGQPVLYSRGDSVLNQGIIYKCLDSTTLSPFQAPKSWESTGVGRAYTSGTPPLNPSENQIWITDGGVQYVYYTDSNGSQWIET